MGNADHIKRLPSRRLQQERAIDQVALSTTDAVSPRDPNSPQFRSLAEVAQQLGLSISHLRREIRLRRLPHHEFGRLIRISEADLAAYVASRRRGAR